MEEHKTDVELLLRKYEERLKFLDSLKSVMLDTLQSNKLNDLRRNWGNLYAKMNRDRTYKGSDIMVPLMGGDSEFKKAAERLHKFYGEKIPAEVWKILESQIVYLKKMIAVKAKLFNEKPERWKPDEKKEIVPSPNMTAGFFVIEPIK